MENYKCEGLFYSFTSIDRQMHSLNILIQQVFQNSSEIEVILRLIWNQKFKEKLKQNFTRSGPTADRYMTAVQLHDIIFLSPLSPLHLQNVSVWEGCCLDSPRGTEFICPPKHNVRAPQQLENTSNFLYTKLKIVAELKHFGLLNVRLWRYQRIILVRRTVFYDSQMSVDVKIDVLLKYTLRHRHKTIFKQRDNQFIPSSRFDQILVCRSSITMPCISKTLHGN